MLIMAGRRKNRVENGGVGARKGKKRKELQSHRLRVQDVLFGPDYILKKVFRKEGPPLGAVFDSLPSHAFELCGKESKNSHHACQENQRAIEENEPSRYSHHSCDEIERLSKRQKVCKPVCDKKNKPVKKHGIGKGLMTVWRAINPDGGDFPGCFSFQKTESISGKQMPTSARQKPCLQEKRSQRQKPAMRKLGKGIQVKDKKKAPKVENHKNKEPRQPWKEKCELALEGLRSHDDEGQYAMLEDDEELELRELQQAPSPPACSVHLGTNGLHGCPLCKDLLAKFPPNSVMMRPPFFVQPWISSPELVKKLFKVLHFLYTYAIMFDIFSFTLDDLAQAFHDKDSMLLGKIHVNLLKLLISDIETELNRGFSPHVSKNCKFLQLLHWVEHQESVLDFWKKSLNSLTWIEILHQVFVAAGFGSKCSALRNDAVNKDVSLMVKYGLSPGTLKAELFSILSEQGNNGIKVSDLVKNSQIIDLHLAATTDELENLIFSTLSSDITLFEKISCASYRLRKNSVTKEDENLQLYSEDSGSVDDDSEDDDTCSSSDDSDHDSGTPGVSELRKKDRRKSRNSTSTVCTEIDESHPGEVWLLGLMEGEYSDLSIEEKLNTLVSLIDLLSAGSSIRKEDSIIPAAECVSRVNSYGSGAKIKRLSRNQYNMPTSLGSQNRQFPSIKEDDTTSGSRPIDSSTTIMQICPKTASCGERKDKIEFGVDNEIHPMQSIFLGSDRRYNRYWLFLGPCNAFDPGHKRIYFESSEDGHWEVIDTEEALCIFLSALDCRGMREAYLLSSLRRKEAFLYQEMSSMINDARNRLPSQSDISNLNMSREDSSSAVSDVDNNLCLTETISDIAASSGDKFLETGNKEHQKQKWYRSQAFDSWIWKSFYCDLNAVKYGSRSYLDSLARCECCHDLYWRDEKHCKTCHTTFELDFDLEEKYAIHVATCRENGETNVFPKHKVLSSQLQALKAAIYAIESVMPEGALVGAWSKSAHKLWIKRLRRTSTLAEFLQVLADFVDAINEEWLYQCNVDLSSNFLVGEIIASFTTLPQTTSAIALWLVKLDASISPQLERAYSEKRRGISCKTKR